MTKATDVISVAIHQVNKISKKFNLAVVVIIVVVMSLRLS